MFAILAADLDWCIGKNNKLLVHLPPDLAYFKRVTAGCTVIMGHSTLLSLPKSKPLSGRENLVLSHDKTLKIDGAKLFSSISELLAYTDTLDGERVAVIGGESVYRALLPYCGRVYVTRLFGRFGGDRYFPDLDSDGGFICDTIGEENEYNGLKYRFFVYRRS